MSKTVGVALGGGGAKGLAHIAILQTLDEMGVEVTAISGTSIGAIIGSLYAAGKSGAEVREGIDAILRMPKNLSDALESKRFFGWLELLNVEIGKSHLLEADAFLSELEGALGVSHFEDLQIPLQVVAADFWDRREVVFGSGPIMPAIEASFCLPGVFEPVRIDDMTLVDGGCVNPVPFDLVRDQCDIVIAVDVLGKRVPDDDLTPSYSEALFNTYQIAEKTISTEKMKYRAPDIYIEPPIKNVKMLEFQKSEQIFVQTQPECERLKVELAKLLAD